MAFAIFKRKQKHPDYLSLSTVFSSWPMHL